MKTHKIVPRPGLNKIPRGYLRRTINVTNISNDKKVPLKTIVHRYKNGKFAKPKTVVRMVSQKQFKRMTKNIRNFNLSYKTRQEEQLEEFLKMVLMWMPSKHLLFQTESLVIDMYRAICKMKLHEMLEYFQKKQKFYALRKGNEFKNIMFVKFYTHWGIVLTEIILDFPSGTKREADLHAGWIMKQINRGRLNLGSEIAMGNTLRKMWLRGLFSKKYKEDVCAQLEELGLKTDKYGILKS